jgi:acetyl esterase/lipase
MTLNTEEQQKINNIRQAIYNFVAQNVSNGKVDYVDTPIRESYIKDSSSNIEIFKKDQVNETDAQGTLIVSDIKRTAYHIVIDTNEDKPLKSDICISFPQLAKPQGILYYINGGGFWLNGLAQTDAKISEAIAKGANQLLINMSYPISPEYKIPEINRYIHAAQQAIEDYLPKLVEDTITKEALDNVNLDDLPRSLIALSAGCTPATYMLATSSKKFNSINFVSPLVDLSDEAMSMEHDEPLGAGLTVENIVDGNKHALGQFVSPYDKKHFIAHRSSEELYSIFKDSNIMVAYGEREVLLSSSKQFSKKLKEAGLEVQEIIHKDKLHGDFQKPGNEIAHEIIELLQKYTSEDFDLLGKILPENCSDL